MQLNVATFALRVTHAIGIDAATANSATSQEYALFLSWLNEGVVNFLRKTKIYKQTAALAVTADKADYTFPTSVLAFEDVSYSPSGGQARSLTQIDSWQVRDMRHIETATDPLYYSYEGQVVMLYPTPRSSSDTLHILYVPRPTALAATADSPSTIPEEYHSVVEAYVKWKAGEHANDKSSGNGQAFKQEYESGLVEARVAEFRKAGMRVGSANIGRGSNNAALAGPGIDLGG